jgi:hypothetical protein
MSVDEGSGEDILEGVKLCVPDMCAIWREVEGRFHNDVFLHCCYKPILL